MCVFEKYKKNKKGREDIDQFLIFATNQIVLIAYSKNVCEAINYHNYRGIHLRKKRMTEPREKWQRREQL